MDHYAGVGVSLEASSVCVVDSAGKIAREARIAGEPAARVGLEAGPLSQWPCAAMNEAGLAAETRYARTAP